MKKPSLDYLLLDITCSSCKQQNMKRIRELKESKDFLCTFCKNPVSLSNDKTAAARFKELVDFIEHAYIPES